MKNPIKGALDQLQVRTRPNGDLDHYLWGFEGPYDSWVWISAQTYARIVQFLLHGTENDLDEIEGFMASEHDDGAIAFGEPRDEESIPFGARVDVSLCMQDRHDETSNLPHRGPGSAFSAGSGSCPFRGALCAALPRSAPRPTSDSISATSKRAPRESGAPATACLPPRRPAHVPRACDLGSTWGAGLPTGKATTLRWARGRSHGPAPVQREPRSAPGRSACAARRGRERHGG